MMSKSSATSSAIEAKIQKINEEFCRPWSEKLFHALFKDTKDQQQTVQHTNSETTTTTESSVSNQQVETTDATKENTPNVTSEKKTEKDAPSPRSKDELDMEEELEELRRKEAFIIKERPIQVEFEWASFNDLFTSLINEGAAEVIDTILDSLISKDCAVSLLGSLLLHCKLPEAIGSRMTKHEQIRTFLQKGLKKYIIKYSDDPREWGFYKDGVLCDVVEIDVTDDEQINWIFRDVTQNIENCTELQQSIINNYYIPLYRYKIRQCLHKDVRLQIDWHSIDFSAHDYAKAVYTIYHDSSSYVLDEVFRAFEAIATYEDDDLVDAISHGVDKVVVALQPGTDSTRKDFDIEDQRRLVILRVCLEADEFAGVFRHRDLVPIFKLAGLYEGDYTKIYKHELLSSAAQLFKVPRGDLNLFKQIIDRKSYWTDLDEKEGRAIDGCKKYIEKYYRDRLQGWSGDANEENEENDEEEEEEEYEKFIKGWHVIKFNKKNLHQERYLVLTNKAYWTFKFDQHTGKVDEKHYKRHDLLDFFAVDIGVLEQTEQFSILALKLFTKEKRKLNALGQEYSEVKTVKDGVKKSKVSMELRKSIKIKANTNEDMMLFRNIRLGQLDDQAHQYKPREKKPKPAREHPNTQGCYNSVFLPYGTELDPQTIKERLTEIAWCLYAAASSRQRTKCSEPFFEQSLTRPKGSLSSFLYNALKMGVSKTRRGTVKSASGGSGTSSKNHSPSNSMTNSPMVGDGKKAQMKTKQLGETVQDSPSSPAIGKSFIRHVPNVGPVEIFVKPILKRRKPAPSLGLNSDSPKAPGTPQPGTPPSAEGAASATASAEEEDDSVVPKASHDRKVIFKPEVQVFYHETGDDDGEDDYYGANDQDDD